MRISPSKYPPPPNFCSLRLLIQKKKNREEARNILDTQSDIDDSEKEFLLEYYSLVREGKTNYISTHSFHDITGSHPQEPTDFFKTYSAEFKPKRRKTSK